MKSKLLQTLIAIGAVTSILIACAPCLLIFSESQDGAITIWNFVGIIYTIALVMVVKTIHDRYDGQW